MGYQGDIVAGQILYGQATFVKADGTPTTPAGSPAVVVYKDNSTTESTAGITFTNTFDSVAGLVNIKIDTSADGTFYAAGHDFSVVVSAGTVDGISVVGYELISFSIENRTQKADLRKINGSTLSTSTAQLGVNVVSISTDAINAAAVATDAVTELQAGMLTASGVRTALGLATANLDTQLTPLSTGVKIAANGLTKNAAFTALPFVMTANTTHLPLAGLTVTVTRLIDGGSFGSGSLGSITDKGNGTYVVSGAASDTNGTYITFLATATGADATIFTIITVP